MRALAAILLICALIPTVAGFGSVTTKEGVVWSGGSPSFTILLYASDENTSTPLSFTSTVPANWEAVIDRPEVIVAPGVGQTIISTSAGPVHAQSVTVTVTPPPHPVPGIYHIALNALQKEQGGGVAIRQERQFPFTVIVPGTPPTSEEEPNTTNQQQTQNPINIPIETQGNTIVWTILLLVGVVIVLKIFRYI